MPPDNLTARINALLEDLREARAAARMAAETAERALGRLITFEKIVDLSDEALTACDCLDYDIRKELSTLIDNYRGLKPS